MTNKRLLELSEEYLKQSLDHPNSLLLVQISLAASQLVLARNSQPTSNGGKLGDDADLFKRAATEAQQQMSNTDRETL